MNKVYKVIWSKAKNCYVVASELAKNHTKAPASKVLSKTVIAGILACVLSCGAVVPAYAEIYTAGGGIVDSNLNGGRDHIVIGTGAYARNVYNGEDNEANNMIVIGDHMHASGEGTIAIGATWQTEEWSSDDKIGAWGSHHILMGENSYTSGYGNISLGATSRSEGGQIVNLGTSTNSVGSYIVNIGTYARSLSQGATAIGNSSLVLAEGGTAIGLDTGVFENATNSVAIGKTSNAVDADVVSFGHQKGEIWSPTAEGNTIGGTEVVYFEDDYYRRLVNVADGVDEHDVVTKGQLDAATAYYGVNSTGGTNIDGSGAVGPDAIAIGKDANASTVFSLALGRNASTALAGTNSDPTSLTNYPSMAIGAFSKSGVDGVAVGTMSEARSNASTALGEQAIANKGYSVALGSTSYADEENVISVGHKAGDVAQYSYYDGSTNYVPYDSDLYRRIVNVADGINNHDVVTVGQMKSFITPVSNGTFIRTTNTGGQNLTALDTASKNAVKSMTVDGSTLIYTKGDNSTVSVDLSSIGQGSAQQIPNGKARTTTVGSVTAFASNSTPTGYLLCDGREVSRTEYAALFQKIGTTYGAGDGSTTFNLPNLVGRFVEGSNASGQYIGAGLPNITGNFTNESLTGGSTGPSNVAGAFYVVGDGRNHIGQDASHYDPGNQIVVLDASRSSSLYGASNTVQPESLMMQYYIKISDDVGGARYIGINSEGGDNEYGEGATGTDSVAIGKNASAGGAQDVAIGYNTHTVGANSIAIGNGSSANTGIAIGVNAKSTSSGQVAIGRNANTSVPDGLNNVIAIGNDTNNLSLYGGAYTTIGINSIALGSGAIAVGARSYALGNDAVTPYNDSIAIGDRSVSQAVNTVSFGHKATDLNYAGNAYGSDLLRRLTNVADGTSATDVATVGQVRTVSAGNGIIVTETDNTNGSKNEAISVKVGTNIVVDANGVSAPGNGTIAENDTGLVSGGTLYNEVHLGSDGTYVKQNRTTARNIRELDAQIASNDGDIAQNASDITNLKDLSNITETGETVIKNLAKGSSTVVSGTNSNVVKTTVDGVDIYTVNVPGDGAVIQGNTGLVSGNTVYSALQAQNTSIQNSLDDKANKDASNVTDASAWANKIGTGTVSDTDAKLVTGATVAGETRVAENGNYVAKNKTAGQNISALDAQVKTNANNIVTNTSAINTNTTDIANLKNMSNITEAGQTVIKNLSKGSVNVVGADKATVVKTDVNGVDTYTVSVKADGTITEGNENLVSGGTVYTAIQNAQSDLQDGLDGKLNRSLNNIRPEGQGVVRGLAQEAVKVVDGTNTTVAEGADGNAKTYAVNVTTNGSVVSGNTGIVTGDTVYQAIQDAVAGSESGTDTALAGKANVDASNVTDAQAWAEKIGTGTVSDTDKKLVTGKTVAEETRITSDGNYISKDNTIAENISAVDLQVKQNANAIATNTTDIANLKNLSNLTDDGKTVIKNLSKGSVNVTGSGKAVVTKSDVGGVDTYDIKVNSNGVIAENNEDLVTGGTVYSAIQDAISASEADITTQLNRKANRDASNINNIQPWAEKLGVGTIDEGDTNLVTGKTVAEETRIASDGNYVLQTNTAGQNIIALDTQVKANADAITTLQTTASDMSETKANVGLDNISNSGQTVIRELAKDSVKVVDGVSTSVTEGTDGDTKTYAVNVVKDGIVAEGNEGVVTGGTVYEAIENVIANSEAGTATALEGKANVDASNVTNSSAWANKLDTGMVTEGNRELVSGGKVYTAIQTAKSEITDAINDLADDVGTTLETKANVSLDNINENGKTVIRNLAKNAVSVANGVNTTVSSETDVNGNVIYKVNATGTGEVQLNDTRLVNGDTVTKAIVNAVGNVMDYTNDGFDKKAEKDASNVADYAKQWGESIGTGAVAKNNKELVTGGTMYTELRPVNGNYVSNTNTTAQNISALDTQVKSNTDSIENLQNNTSTALSNKANTNLDNLTTEGETVVRDLAKDSVKVIDGTYTTVVKGTEENTTTYAVNVVADGIVETGNTGIVTGGTVKEAIDTLSSATDTKLEEYAKKDASNVTDASAWANAIGTGEVASDNTELVTGGKVYTAIYNVVDTAVTDIQGSLTDKANTNLDNLTSDGKTVIRTITKDAVKVADGTNTSVSSETDANGNITYKVNAVANGTVAEGDTGLVSGDTVYDAVMTMAEVTGTELAGKANVDASNITDADAWGEKIATGIISDNEGKAVSGKTVYTAIETAKTELGNTMNTALADYAKKDASNIQVSDWAIKLGTGTVATNDTNLVTGDTIAREVRIAEDGNYVRKDNTVAQNLNSIDTVLKETRDMVDSVTASESNSLHYDDASKEKVTLAGSEGTIITNLKDGDLSENSTDAVTGKQLFETNQQVQVNTDAIQSVNDKLGTVTEGSYVSNDKTFGENLNALDTQVKVNTDSITEIQETMGGIVSNMDSKLNTDLSNLSETGTDTIRDLAQKSIEATSNDGSVIITKTDAEGVGKGRTFDFSVKKDGVVAEGNNDIVTGDAVYQAIQNIDMPEETNYVGVNSQDNEDMNYHGGGATGDNAIAIGVGTTSSGEEAVAIGHGATVSGLQSIAVGTKNQVSGNHSGAFGDPNDVSGDGSYAVGNDNTISGDNTFVFGNNVEATGSNSVVLGNNSDGSQDNVVSVGRNGNERKIVHVADGEISANSKDAINGSQLFKVAEDFANAQNINVDEWTNALATGTISEGDGGLVTGGQVYDVAKNLGNSFSDLIAPDVSGTQIRLGGGTVYDSVDTINIAKSNGEGRVMTGVITDPSDLNSAANVGYVNAIGQNVLNAANSAIQDVSTKANKIGASAAAMASLEAPPMDGDEKWAFSAAVGHYEGETAGAVGAFYRPQDNVIVNVRGSVGNGEDMIGAGVGVALQRGNTPSVSKAQLVRTINAQAGKIKEQDNRIAELESQVATMMEMFKQQQ